MLGEVAQQCTGIGLAEQRRRLAHRDRAGSEGFDRKPERGQFVAARQQPLDGGLVDFDDFRDQQDLPLHAVFRERRFQSLIDDALMRGVLVDDNEAVAGLRDDIGLVDLRPCRAERAVEQVGGRLFLKPNIGGRRADIEGRLAGLGERGRGGALKAGCDPTGKAGERRQSQFACPPFAAAAQRQGGAPRSQRRRYWPRCACLRARGLPSARARSRRARARHCGSALRSWPDERWRRPRCGSSVTNSATTGWRSRGR